MNRFEKFLPSFMKQFNHYLLLNKPNLWATRVHMVIFLGLLFSTLLIGISFLVPMNYWEESKIATVISFTVIFSIISFIIWLVYLFRFNPFKRFADDNTVRKPGSALVEFISYSGSICMFVLWSFIPPAIESYRTLNQLASKELASDINELNLKVSALEFDSTVMAFSADTAVFSKDIDATNEIDYSEYAYTKTVPGANYRYHSIESMNEVLATCHYYTKINDTCYVLRNAPYLDFVSGMDLNQVSELKQLAPIELYKKAKSINIAGFNSDQYFEDVVRLCKKYDHNWSLLDAESGRLRKDIPIYEFENIRQKYGLYQVGYNMNDISTRMTRWTAPHLVEYAHVVLYVVMFLSMAIFMFRHCHIKPYFVSYLMAFLLVAIMSLLMAISGVYSSTSILVVILVYFFAFLSVAFSVFYTQKRNNVQIIATNISFFVFPFVPYLITLLYLTIKQEGTIGEEYELVSQQIYSCVPICEVLGVLLLLVVVELVYKKIYAQWLSMPEE